MTFRAPVVREISRRVLDHTDADWAKDLRAPIGDAGLTSVFGFMTDQSVTTNGISEICIGKSPNYLGGQGKSAGILPKRKRMSEALQPAQ
jgi:hypothetical protein